jgi:hypothetical protein
VLHVCTPDGRVLRFARPFTVGRDPDCELRLQHPKVSRHHLAVSYRNGQWRIDDAGSANGMFVDGRRVESCVVSDAQTVTMGLDGPSLLFELNPQGGTRPGAGEAAPTVLGPGSDNELLADLEKKYFGAKRDTRPAGGRTVMIRRAFERVHRKQRRRLAIVVAAFSVLLIAAVGHAIYKARQVARQEELAQLLFYDMKALDVAIANIERRVAGTADADVMAQVAGQRERRRQMDSTYDSYLKTLNLYDSHLSPEDKLILRVTRRFGECELGAPDEYMRLVKTYIKEWQSSGRLATAVDRATKMGYTPRIAEEFIKQNLPPQFFYLALQESDFDAFTSGPPTRWGFAKGMWQFIPDTAKRYGLAIGPLSDQPRPDVRDDRHDWQKATNAAARYIKDIYSTDAQASGLLVMASYNWGENRVINLLRSMPANPGDRNFWKVLARHHDQVPDETYKYVFRIVSAAVIGEDPQLFGFPFSNPLAQYDDQ